MNQNAQKKLERIMQIQQEIHNLQKELETILEGRSEVGNVPARKKKMAVSGEERARLREYIRHTTRRLLEQPGFRTTDNAIFSTCRGQGNLVTRSQVALILSWMARRGEIKFGGQTDDGREVYKA